MKIYDLKRNIELTKKRGFDRIVCDLEDLDNVIQEVETLKHEKAKQRAAKLRKQGFRAVVVNDDELINYFDGQQVLGWQTLDDIKKVMFEVAMLPKQ